MSQTLSEMRSPGTDDLVDRPKHYGGTECIEAIEAALGKDAVIAFCQGNAMKYIWRAGKKNPAALAQDLAKASWYLNYAVEALGR